MSKKLFLANHPNTIHPYTTPITTRTLMIMMIAPVATHDKLRVWFSTTVSLTPTGRPNPGKMSCVVILMILITARACSLLYPSPSPDREVNKDWDRMIIFAPSDQKYHLSKQRMYHLIGTNVHRLCIFKMKKVETMKPNQMFNSWRRLPWTSGKWRH